MNRGTPAKSEIPPRSRVRRGQIPPSRSRRTRKDRASYSSTYTSSGCSTIFTVSSHAALEAPGTVLYTLIPLYCTVRACRAEAPARRTRTTVAVRVRHATALASGYVGASRLDGRGRATGGWCAGAGIDLGLSRCCLCRWLIQV